MDAKTTMADERNDVARDALACLRVAMAMGELHHATATQARYILGSAGTLGMLDEACPELGTTGKAVASC